MKKSKLVPHPLHILFHFGKNVFSVYLSRQFCIFLAFGGLAAAANLAIGHFLYDVHAGLMPYWAAVVLAGLCGLIVNFTLNYLFNFNFRKRHWLHQFGTFCVVSGIGMALTAGIASSLSSIAAPFGITRLALPFGHSVSVHFCTHFVAIGVVTFYSFAAHKAFSFSVGIRARIMAFRAKRKR